MRAGIGGIGIVLAAVLAPAGLAHGDDGLWALLERGGQVVLMRHAITTPGVGDPAGMRLDDCASQRNLAHATEMADNPAFRLKLVLVLGAVLNAAAFHRWPFRGVARWDVDARPPRWARVAAVVSLVCWTGAIVCGRLLAYL